MQTTSIYPIRALETNYIWAIVNQQRKTALIVDPGEAQPVLRFLHQHALILKAILVTHHHWDHVNGISALIETYPVPVFGGVLSTYNQITHQIPNDTFLNVNNDFPSYQVISTPGHTLDHIAYYGHGAIFCGDTLFSGGCGRLFEGTAEQLYTSILKIAQLPDNTALYCAHEYTLQNLNFAHIVDPKNRNILQRIDDVQKQADLRLPSLPSTLSIEKKTNPFLRCNSAEVIRQAELRCGHALNSAVSVFAELRKWKDDF